jgi:hypothetical protein
MFQMGMADRIAILIDFQLVGYHNLGYPKQRAKNPTDSPYQEAWLTEQSLLVSPETE